MASDCRDRLDGWIGCCESPRPIERLFFFFLLFSFLFLPSLPFSFSDYLEHVPTMITDSNILHFLFLRGRGITALFFLVSFFILFIFPFPLSLLPAPRRYSVISKHSS